MSNILKEYFRTFFKIFTFFYKKCGFFVDISKKERYNSSDMEKYVHKKNFEIKYCDTDFRDRLKLSAVLAYFEEVAGSSADELGFGYKDLKPKSLTFMVSGVCCEFLKPIFQGETVTVKTWPNPPSYAVFGREYQICNPDSDELLCSATSRWCIYSFKEDKLLSSKVIEGQDYSTYNTDRALDFSAWKIQVFTPEEGEYVYSMTVRNAEYDHNMHVNNTRYADYCVNCFTIAELSNLTLKRFQISYAKQCRENDVLSFYRKQTSENEFTVLGLNQNNDMVVASKFTFETAK